MVFVLVVGLPELLLRLILFRVDVPRPGTVCAWLAVDEELQDLSYFLMPDEHCFYDVRPGAHYSYFATPMDAINRDGFRGPPLWEYPPRIRIVCLGDSSTFGMCVSEAMTWCRQLEGQLREQYVGEAIEVVNAGVIGYTVYHGLQKYRHKIRKLSPNIVILAFGAVNEQMPSATGNTILKRADSWQRNYSSFRQNWLNHVWDLRIVQFLGQPLLEARKKQREYLSKKELLNSAKFERGEPYTPCMSYSEFRGCLQELCDEVRVDGATVVLVNPHRRHSTEAKYPQLLPLSEIIVDVAQSRQIALFDANRLFKNNSAFEVEYFADTHHPNVAGNRVLAQGLVSILIPIIDKRLHAEKRPPGTDSYTR